MDFYSQGEPLKARGQFTALQLQPEAKARKPLF